MKAIKANPLVSVLLVVIIGFVVYNFWPKGKEPKKKDPVKTFAIWWVDPVNGRDTGSIVLRLDYDTLYPYKELKTPIYYVPIIKYDSTHKTASPEHIKDSVKRTLIWSYRDTVIIIKDFDKHYGAAQ